MPLELQWANLWNIALPYVLCLSVACILTVFLWRAAWKSGLPHRREPCANCVFEEELLRRGTCVETCAVNVLPGLPLLLFVVACSFTLLFFFFPSLVVQYLLPPDLGANFQGAVLTFVAGTNGAVCVLLAAYFAQDKAFHRELLFRITAAGALGGIVGGLILPAPWGTLALDGSPLALLGMVLAASLEHRALAGRPVLGMKALGACTFPLFLLALVGLTRILYVLNAAFPGLY